MRGPTRVEEAAPVESRFADAVAARCCASQPDRAEQREARVEVRLGDADAGALRGGGELGAADVRTPPQQLGRHADGHLRGRLRNRLRARREQAVDGAGRLPEQRAQRVSRLLQPDLAAAGWSPACSRAASSPGSRPAPRSRRCGSGTRRSAAPPPGSGRSRCACSMSTSKVRISDVGARDLRGQRDERLVVVGHRREQAAGLRLDAAPVLAPEVQLPRGVEARPGSSGSCDREGPATWRRSR